MESKRKNRSLFIDKEAVSALSLVKYGLLSPVDKLMNKSEAEEVDRTKLYKGRTFPFSFLLAPSGKRNEEILKSATKGEVLNLVCEGKEYGHIVVDEVFMIDREQRVQNIFGIKDSSHPGVSKTLKRLGNYALCGEFEIEFENVSTAKLEIKEAIKRVDAKNISAMMMAAKPLHRAHERMIRLALEDSDLLVIFLLKPYGRDILSFDIRYKSVKYFIDNFVPMDRAIVVPLDNTYIFAGNNEMILDAIVAQNFGCSKLVTGANHVGLGIYYDKNIIHSVFDTLKGIDIDIELMNEFVYCNICKTLVSTKSCPHGRHHHISYHSRSIMELFRLGMLPPAVLVRKEISAMLLAHMFPDRFKNIDRLYDDMLPLNGLVEHHSEVDFYIGLMDMHQTSSLT
jgi:sulfate adenylyltransferase